MKTTIIALVTFIVGVIAGAFLNRAVFPCAVPQTVSVKHDTTYRVDTVALPVPPPIRSVVIRHDTVRQTDTVRGPQPHVTPSGDIDIPIERRTYATQAYKAVVSGYRPALDSMTVYPVTQTVTNTVTKTLANRWGVTIGPGVTFGTGGRVTPGASITIGYTIKGWR